MSLPLTPLFINFLRNTEIDFDIKAAYKHNLITIDINCFHISLVMHFTLQSHIDEQSDREDDMRDCESSDEGVNVNVNGTLPSGMDYNSSRSPDRNTDLIK